MTKDFLILALICLSFVSLQENKFNIKLVDAKDDPEVEENQIRVGIYKKFLLTVTPTSKRVKAKVHLKFIDPASDPIVAQPQDIYIDTHTSLEYPVYIGAGCQSDIVAGTKYNVNFSIEDGDDKEKFNAPETLVVTFINKPAEAFVFSGSRVIPSDSYSIYRTDETIRNVDPFTLSFVQKEGDDNHSVEVKPLTIKSFFNERSSYDELISGKIIANYPEEKPRTNDHHIFTAKIEDNKCVIPRNGSDILEFDVKETKLATFSSPSLKRNILKSIALVDMKSNNTIGIRMKTYAYPVLLSCVMMRNRENFPSDDIIRAIEPETQGQNLRFFQRFVEDEEEKTLEFTPLSRLGGYKAKCIIDNTALRETEKDSFIFTLGTFDGVSKSMTLMPDDNAPIYGNCISWVFGQISTETKQKAPKLLDYACNDYFTEKYGDKAPWEKNGCYQCVERRKGLPPVSGDDFQLGVCLEAVESCPSDYPFDSKEGFEQFANTVSSTDSLRKLLGDNQLELKSHLVEYDNDYPDTSKINVKKTALTKSNITFEISSTDDQTIECLFKPIDDMKVSEITIDDIIENPKKTTVTLFVGKPETVTMEFVDEGFDDFVYNLVAICYNVPGTEYNAHVTEPFAALSFLRKDDLPDEYEKKEKPSCEGNTLSIDCLGRKPHTPPIWRSINPKEDNSNDVKYFGFLTNPEQMKKMQMEIDHLIQVGNLKLLVDQTGYVAELLSKRNCDTNINYEKCIESKISYFNQIFKALQFYVPKDKIVDTVQNLKTNQTEFILIFVQDIFALTNNFDCIRNEVTFNSVYEYVSEVVNKSEALYDLFTTEIEEDQVVNYAYYLSASVANLFDAMAYIEAAGVIKPNNKTYFIEDPRVDKIKSLLHQSLQHLFKTSEHYFSYETFHYKYERRGSRNLRNLVEDDWGHEVFFDSLNIKAYFREKLFTQYNGYIATTYCYDYYPYVSNNNSAISRHFVGFKLYDINNTEITNITSIKSNEKPIVTYGVNDEGNDKWVTCKRFDLNKKTTTINDMETSMKTDESNNTFINCTIGLLGEVTIGNQESSGTVWLIVLLCVAALALVSALLYFLISMCKKRKPSSKIIAPLESPSPLLSANE